MGTRRSLTTKGSCLICSSYKLSPSTRASTFPAPALSLRRYVPSPSPGRKASHAHSNSPDKTASAGSSDSSQAIPLSGYYQDILSTRSPYQHQASSSRPIPRLTEKPSPAASVEPQSPQDKMSIVFGTRLASPGRSSRYNPSSMPPESTWKTVNGVAIPPRPEEPDNCCMSGCAHCVWDDFRDEMEEWAERLEQAKAKSTSPGPAREARHTARAEVSNASMSMDDDGGGSEANWPAPNPTDDLFANIPVGIREFMKTEKKLKQKHQHESTEA